MMSSSHVGMISTASLVVCMTIPVFGEPSEWDRAWWFREQVGLAPTDLAAMGVPANVQEPLIIMVRGHFAAHPNTHGVLIDELAEVAREVASTVSWGRNPRNAFDHLRAQRQIVLQMLRSLGEQARDLLPVTMRPYVARAMVNTGLDSPYRLLDFTAPQRVQIAALQEQRDTVLHDARQRHRPARLDEARQRFIDEVHPLLTPTQQTELDRFNANIEANFQAVWEIELAGFPLPEPRPPSGLSLSPHGTQQGDSRESGGNATPDVSAICGTAGHPEASSAQLRHAGFEPATFGSVDRCSIQLS